MPNVSNKASEYLYTATYFFKSTLCCSIETYYFLEWFKYIQPDFWKLLELYGIVWLLTIPVWVCRSVFCFDLLWLHTGHRTSITQMCSVRALRHNLVLNRPEGSVPVLFPSVGRRIIGFKPPRGPLDMRHWRGKCAFAGLCSDYREGKQEMLSSTM